MPAQIENSMFCATYWAVYEVPSSDGSKTYKVELSGGEGSAYCDCPAWLYFKGPEYDRTCKHISYVWDNACLWNPQWHKGGPGTLKPTMITTNTIPDHSCPHCGGPVVPVHIAV